MSSLLRRTVCSAALVALAFVAVPSAPAAATSPCDSVTGTPRPPIGSPEPLISGTILDDVNAGVSGATVNLYRCQGTSAVYVTQTTSTSTGAYSFGSLIQNWYYVEVALTGPLAGKSPSSGTSNPSSLIEVGEGILGLSFAFE